MRRKGKEEEREGTRRGKGQGGKREKYVNTI